MNRLLLRPIARAIRAQRPPVHHHHHCVNVSLIASPCRQFTSSSSLRAAITPSEQQLSSLLASGMQQDELAKEIARLFSRTKENWLILQLEDQLIKHTNKTGERQLLRKFNEYLHQIGAEVKAQKAAAEATGISRWFSAEARAALARKGLELTDYVAELLETPPAANAIMKFKPEEIDQFEEIWVQFDRENSDVWLHKILDFFAARGVDFVPPQDFKETTSRKTPAISGSRNSMYSPAPRQPDGNYPDLMMNDSILDPRDVLDLPPSAESPFHNRVVVRNHRSVFHNYGDEPVANTPDSERDGKMASHEEMKEEPEVKLSQKDVFAGKAPKEAWAVNIDEFTKSLPVAKRFYTGLYQSILMRRTVVQQTGKGKIRRMSFMVLVGNGDGLVGYGEGKHLNSMVALTAARLAAVRNMDWVERFEKRTLWTEMKTKLGATQLILRPRPVGFGLRCNPFLHQILRAAGFKDISAKVWGSRNKLNVIKAAFRMIHAGHAPTSMGDGMGGPGKKLNRGRGLRNMSELERARGRKLISLRK